MTFWNKLYYEIFFKNHLQLSSSFWTSKTALQLSTDDLKLYGISISIIVYVFPTNYDWNRTPLSDCSINIKCWRVFGFSCLLRGYCYLISWSFIPSLMNVRGNSHKTPSSHVATGTSLMWKVWWNSGSCQRSRDPIATEMFNRGLKDKGSHFYKTYAAWCYAFPLHWKKDLETLDFNK